MNPVDYTIVRRKSKKKPVVTNLENNEIVSVGRLVKEKDYRTLIKAFSRVKGEYLLRIIGSGPELEDLQAYVIHLNLKDRVIFMGYEDNPAPYMRNAELCVVSSELEGYPNVLLEMMCVAKRVVSTECTDGIKGLPGVLTCKIKSPAHLAKKMNEALSKSKNDTNKNIKKMRRYVQKLTTEHFVNSILLEAENKSTHKNG
jgi:glycosyltransferase involved in cell wall biosynthesis